MRARIYGVFDAKNDFVSQNGLSARKYRPSAFTFFLAESLLWF